MLFFIKYLSIYVPSREKGETLTYFISAILTLFEIRMVFAPHKDDCRETNRPRYARQKSDVDSMIHTQWNAAWCLVLTCICSNVLRLLPFKSQRERTNKKSIFYTKLWNKNCILRLDCMHNQQPSRYKEATKPLGISCLLHFFFLSHSPFCIAR